MYVNFYGRFYGEVDACANGVYQALSPPPLKGPGDEARQGVAIFSRVSKWESFYALGVTIPAIANTFLVLHDQAIP